MKRKFHLILLFICTTSHAMKVKPKKNSKPCLSQMCLEAIKARNEDVVKKTLSKGADINYHDNNGCSLFFIARKYSNKIIIKLIIKHAEINPFAQDFSRCTPLHVACELGLYKTIKSLICRAPHIITMPNKHGNIPLHSALYAKHTKCIDLLLTPHHTNIDMQNYDGITPLHMACKQLDCNAINLLLAKGADATIKNNKQETPLFTLYENNADNLDELFFENHSDIINKLIQATDQNNNTQFHLCTTLEHIDDQFRKYLKFLISQGLSMQIRNNDGKRAVDLACDEYNTLHHQYLKKKTQSIKDILMYQEIIMHNFLHRNSFYIECALFKAIFLQYTNQLTEIIQLIMYLYYALNIETIIAKKYLINYNCDDYYFDYIENKNAIKQYLLKNPEPKVLWSV